MFTPLFGFKMIRSYVYTKQLKHTIMKIKSIFEQISTEVFQMNNLDEMKRFTIDFVESKKIKDEDRKRIVVDVIKLNSVNAFHRYICNSLLKYEGMSLSKV